MGGTAGTTPDVAAPAASPDVAAAQSPNGVRALTPPGAIKPTGTWDLGARAGDFVYIAGMRGIDPKTNTLVSGDEARIRQGFLNMQMIAQSEGASLRDCVRIVVYVTDMIRFRPLVNKVQEELWGKGPYPPRTIVEVRRLNQDDIFEVEGTFYAPVKKGPQGVTLPPWARGTATLHIAHVRRAAGAGCREMRDAMAIKQFIDNEVKGNDVVLFMKGTPQFPMCGFSGQVVQILDHLGVTYKGLNVLESDDLREGIKSYSNWPTIPQLYVKGEFVGGCDIIREMFQAGELQGLLKDKGVPVRERAST